jgi:hypothetical protein
MTWVGSSLGKDFINIFKLILYKKIYNSQLSY